VAVGDFNDDGKLDIATGNRDSNDVSVLLGDGSGKFTPAPGSPAPVGSDPYSVAVGNFNGDGRLDIATANSSGSVSLLLGNGSGGFTVVPPLANGVGSYPTSVAVGDFNGDGKPDLAITNLQSATVTVLLNTNAPATSVSVAVSPGSVVANGTRTTTATATVSDPNGNPVPGDHVAFSSSDPGEQIGSVTDHGDGTYTATITSSNTVHPVIITATAASVSPSVSGYATMVQTGLAASISLRVTPTSIAANGSSTVTATATATDASGNPGAGRPRRVLLQRSWPADRSSERSRRRDLLGDDYKLNNAGSGDDHRDRHISVTERVRAGDPDPDHGISPRQPVATHDSRRRASGSDAGRDPRTLDAKAHNL
jgi:hypothetical protein